MNTVLNEYLKSPNETLKITIGTHLVARKEGQLKPDRCSSSKIENNKRESVA
jgi:hypothetical protein